MQAAQVQKSQQQLAEQKSVKIGLIPMRGIPNTTKARLTSMETALWRKTEEVFPRPFKMLPIVVEMYIKGQSHARTAIYCPAV